jgi:hypothetical protein
MAYAKENKMDSVLQGIIEKLDDYIGGPIDVADMSEGDKMNLKNHLMAAQQILLRNGNEKLKDVVSGISGAILRRIDGGS